MDMSRFPEKWPPLDVHEVEEWEDDYDYDYDDECSEAMIWEAENGRQREG